MLEVIVYDFTPNFDPIALEVFDPLEPLHPGGPWARNTIGCRLAPDWM